MEDKLKQKMIEREDKRIRLGLQIKGLKEAKTYDGVDELIAKIRTTQVSRA